MFLFFLLSEGFRDLIPKTESGERAEKASSLLLQHLIDLPLRLTVPVVEVVEVPTQLPNALRL